MSVNKLVIVIAVIGLAAVLMGHTVAWNSGDATEPASLYLEADGTRIEGDSPILSLEREDDIYVTWFSMGMTTDIDGATGAVIGRTVPAPIKFRKPIDKSSPLLAKALVNNESIVAKFRFFRPRQDGMTEHHYTIEVQDARISQIRNTLSETGEMVEEVYLVFGRVKWTYEPGGVETEYDPRN